VPFIRTRRVRALRTFSPPNIDVRHRVLLHWYGAALLRAVLFYICRGAEKVGQIRTACKTATRVHLRTPLPFVIGGGTIQYLQAGPVSWLCTNLRYSIVEHLPVVTNVHGALFCLREGSFNKRDVICAAVTLAAGYTAYSRHSAIFISTTHRLLSRLATCRRIISSRRCWQIWNILRRARNSAALRACVCVAFSL